MKNRFSKWPQWRPSWIFDRNSFNYFKSTNHLDVFYQVSRQLEQGRRRSRLLKQTDDAARRTTRAARRTKDNGH